MKHVMHFWNDRTLREKFLKFLVVLLYQDLQIWHLIFGQQRREHNSHYFQKSTQQLPVVIIIWYILPNE
jgi:hypothetical protein